MSSEEKHFYEFKSFRLDVAERQLLNNGVSVPLMPKVFDVLAYLVEHHGHLVEKDELLRTVWADTFVEEANIARIIYELRKVLGEDKNGDKFIETVAKKGYRFVAEVSEPSAVADGFSVNQKASLPTLDPPATADDPDLPRKHTTRIILIAVGFLSAISLIALFAFNYQSNSSIKPNEVKSIAVLPVQPITAENHDALYEFGIADSLILKLSSAKNLIVRPLSATRQYADASQDPIAAGREQKVDFVLASNYQIADGKIRITSQLINVQSGQVEEVFKDEQNNSGIFAVQDAVAANIGQTLLKRLNRESNNVTAKHYTNNEEAYRSYLQGMYLADQKDGNDYRKAAEHFEQAVRLDPNYALAYVGLAYAHRGISIWGGNPREEYLISKNAVEKALQLDENLAEAHSILGEMKDTYEWNFAEAEHEHRRAVELNPNSAFVRRYYGFHLINLARFDDAIAEAKTAIDLDPNSMWNQRVLGINLYFARRYDEAFAQFQRVSEMDTANSDSYAWLWLTLWLKGDYDRAFEYFLQEQTHLGANGEEINSLKTIYAKSGWNGVLRRQLELVKQKEKNDYNDFSNIAGLYFKLGDNDQGFAYLEKSYQKRDFYMSWLLIDPCLDHLRSDQRYDDLIRRVGLK